MTRNRMLYAGVGIAWVGIGLFWVGTALAYWDGNSNVSKAVATGVGGTMILAFNTVGFYFLARKR